MPTSNSTSFGFGMAAGSEAIAGSATDRPPAPE